MKHICVFTVLVIMCVFDIRSKKLPLWLISMVGVLGIGNLWIQRPDVFSMIMGFLPGILLLGLAKLTEEQIGYGDGLLVLSLGGFYDARQICILLMGASMVNFVISGFLLLTKKGNKKTEIPFLPGMLCGFLGMVYLC